MKPNLEVDEWMKDTTHIKKGLYLVQMAPKRVLPVSNQICPICKGGWHNQKRFAVMGNQVFHDICLEKRYGTARFKRFIELKYIEVESATPTINIGPVTN